MTASSTTASSCTTLSGDITADTYLYADNGPFLMTSQVFVQSGATLYIEAGTTIYALSASQASALGNADAEPDHSRCRREWGTHQRRGHSRERTDRRG